MIDATPEFWTPQELTEKEIVEICNWLMAWQKAMVTSDCLASDFYLAEELPSSKLDPAFLRAMHHVESLVRHIHALKLKEKQ